MTDMTKLENLTISVFLSSSVLSGLGCSLPEYRSLCRERDSDCLGKGLRSMPIICQKCVMRSHFNFMADISRKSRIM